VGIFAAFSESQKVKSVLASTGFAPYPCDQGLYSWTLLGAVYRGLTVAFGGLTVAFRGPPTF